MSTLTCAGCCRPLNVESDREGAALRCPWCGRLNSGGGGGQGVDPAPTPPLATPAASLLPVDVPGYEVVAEVGRGGMGVVYKARQAALRRDVALKMILDAEHAGAEQVARFRREAEAVAQIQHPNVVQIYEIGELKGRPYLALEFVEGVNLAQKIRGRPLPLPDAPPLVEILARAVQSAHAKGIIHRDLKPANVLLAKDGTPKVTDFGLAKWLGRPTRHTPSGAILGTPDYMAPEQAGGRGDAVGPAADVYALGAILYELLTGRPPFQAANVVETLLHVLNAPPVPPRDLRPETPPDLEAVCLKCLDKDPSRRYATAGELADDLRRYLNGEATAARPPGRWVRCQRRVARLRRWPLVAAGWLLAVVLSGLLLVPGRNVPKGPPGPERQPVPQGDEQLLQGTWQVVQVEPPRYRELLGEMLRSEGTVTFHRDRFEFGGPAWLHLNGFCYAGHYLLDDQASPKKIDFGSKLGDPFGHTKRKEHVHVLGLYEVEENQLRLCLTADVDKADRERVRPVAWGTFPDKEQLLLTFHRVRPREDRARLQGTWRVVGWEQGGQKVKPPAGPAGELTVRFQGGRVRWPWDKDREMQYTLNPAAHPKAINFIDEPGDEGLGIYEWNGDTLTLCLGSRERPRTFTTRAGDDAFTWTLQRVAE